MKKMLILIICLTMMSVVAFAADKKAQQGNGDRMAKMQKNLGLTDQQVAEIRRIRDAGGGKEEILAVLTEQQVELMNQRRAQMRGNGRKSHRRPPTEDSQVDETTPPKEDSQVDETTGD